MISNGIPSISFDLLIVMASVAADDTRFVKVPLTSSQKLELRNMLISMNKEKERRDLTIFDTFIKIKSKFYLGDAPELHKYPDKTDLVIWTPTIYAQDSTLIHQMSPEWYSLYVESFDWNYQDTEPVKDFNCFINRMDINRQSWLYLLIRRNLFNKGFVSFNMDTTRLDNYDPSKSALEVFDQQFQTHMTNFETEHEIARSVVPYRNFDAEDLGTVLLQSRFSIVLETFFSESGEITFTEKTFRSLIFPRPWLLYAAKDAVETLRSWGFDVLDDLVDHSAYDGVEDCIQRQSIILDLAETMCHFDIAANRTRLQKAAAHNLSLLKQWKADLPDIAKKDTERFLDKVYALYGGN